MRERGRGEGWQREESSEGWQREGYGKRGKMESEGEEVMDGRGRGRR